MTKATKTTPAKPAPAPASETKYAKCRALEVGHRSCNCGRKGCGENR